MALKTAKKKSCWGFTAESLLSRQLQTARSDGQKSARVHVQLGKKSGVAVRTLESPDGVEIFLNPLAAPEMENDSRLKTAPAVRVRDAVGASLGQLERMEVTWAHYDFDLDAAMLDAALLGLEIALYRFKRVYKQEAPKIQLSLTNKKKAVATKTLEAAVLGGTAVNLARHLVNLPPNLLNPVTYAEAVSLLFAGQPHVQVEVWDEKRLLKERMNLLLAVGQASAAPPRLVHVRYRPPGTAKKPPVAFVGKGITFDSGGLDIKPSSGMRLMKKDMGGSASVLGLAWWAVQSQLKIPLDFYVALAENSIGANAMRPSDIVQSRNGQTVEIHNTDAEGRLVLADAMDVAVSQDLKPRYLVDVATLTGAIKVALGSGMAGLFSNDPRLAQALAAAGQQTGDLAWTMPLFQRYRTQLNSPFADVVNSADGFGGAVTAALFLEKYAMDTPWAHFDIYAWRDSADGAWLESGGNGQSVLGLAQWLKGLK